MPRKLLPRPLILVSPSSFVLVLWSIAPFPDFIVVGAGGCCCCCGGGGCCWCPIVALDQLPPLEGHPLLCLGVIGGSGAAFGVTVRFIPNGSNKRLISGNVSPSCQEAVELAVVWANSNVDRISRWLYPRQPGTEHVVLRLLDQKCDVSVHLSNVLHRKKTGFSLGAAVATALILCALHSLGCRPRPHVAITGEINLRGQCLPVNDIGPKITAAMRSGCEVVVIPTGNQSDLEDAIAALPDEKSREWAKRSVVLASDMLDVLENVLEGM